MRFFVLPLLAAGCAWAQGLSFEVASIRPAEIPSPAAIMSGKALVGVHIDGGRADFGVLSMKDLIGIAFKVAAYQIAGPDWIASQRFDIHAKLPDGATQEQLPEMVKALLAERFGLREHEETREHPVYALVVAKGGPKLKESPPAGAAPPAPAEPGSGQPGVSLGVGSQSVTVTAGRGGASIKMSDGANIRLSAGPDGAMVANMNGMTMLTLAQFLSRLTDRPVLDRTEVGGKYDVQLDLSMSDLIAAGSANGVVPPGITAGRAGAAPAGAAASTAASDPSGGSILTSVQKAGLRLEPRREQVETIVVDHVDRNPTEN